MGMKYEIEAELRAHAAWRKHFRDYLNGKACFDVTTAGASDQCDLGKWLADEGAMPQELHVEIRFAHDEFHGIAAEIIVKIKEKRYAEAHADISSDGALNRASTRLSESLLKASLHEGSATGTATGTTAPPDTPSQGTEKMSESSTITPPPRQPS